MQLQCFCAPKLLISALTTWPAVVSLRAPLVFPWWKSLRLRRPHFPVSSTCVQLFRFELKLTFSGAPVTTGRTNDLHRPDPRSLLPCNCTSRVHARTHAAPLRREHLNILQAPPRQSRHPLPLILGTINIASGACATPVVNVHRV